MEISRYSTYLLLFESSFCLLLSFMAFSTYMSHLKKKVSHFFLRTIPKYGASFHCVLKRIFAHIYFQIGHYHVETKSFHVYVPIGYT